MKKLFILLLASALLTLVSCVKKVTSDYTPQIALSEIYVNPTFHGDTLVSAEDTMRVKYDADLGAYIMDTMYLSPRDTAVFVVGFASLANDLISTRINFDTAAINLQATITSTISSVLEEKSDLRTVQLFYKPGYNGVTFPVGYAPLKVGTHKIEFVVESDSKYSPSNLVFLQPVVESRPE